MKDVPSELELLGDDMEDGACVTMGRTVAVASEPLLTVLDCVGIGVDVVVVDDVLVFPTVTVGTVAEVLLEVSGLLTRPPVGLTVSDTGGVPGNDEPVGTVLLVG